MTTRLQRNFNDMTLGHVSLESHHEWKDLTRQLSQALADHDSISLESEEKQPGLAQRAKEIISAIWEKIVALAARLKKWVIESTGMLERRARLLSAKVKEASLGGNFRVSLPENLAVWYQPNWEPWAQNTVAGFTSNGMNLFKAMEELGKAEVSGGIDSDAFKTKFQQVSAMLDKLMVSVIDRNQGLGGESFRRSLDGDEIKDVKDLARSALLQHSEKEEKPKTDYQFTADTLADLVVEAERDLSRVKDNSEAIESFFEDIRERALRFATDKTIGDQVQVQYARMSANLYSSVNHIQSNAVKAISKRLEIANYILRNNTREKSAE